MSPPAARAELLEDRGEAATDDSFFRSRPFLDAEAAGWLLQLLVNFHLVARLPLFRDEIHDALNLLVGDQSTLRTDEPCRARRQVKHVTLAKQSLSARQIEDDAAVGL